MKYSLLIICLFISVLLSAQCEKVRALELKQLLLPCINETDTIYFIGEFRSWGKPVESDFLELLDKKEVINIKNYGTAIEFIPLGWTRALYLPINEVNGALDLLLKRKFNSGKKFCLRGVRVKHFETWSKNPFFLVDQIWVE